MPIFNEFIITKTSDIAWYGGKPTENLIPNDANLVFDSTGGGRSAYPHQALGLMSWDRPRTTTAQAVQRTTTTAFRMTASLCCFTRPSRAISF